VVDAESALAYGTPIPALVPAGPLMPDYFVTVAGGPVFVIECKGSSTDVGRVTSLAKAMRQLCSVSYRGSPPPGFAVHTRLNGDGFESVILDPDADDAWTAEPTPRHDRRPALHAEEGSLAIEDPGSFRGELEDLAESALLSWSGAESAAVALLPERVRARLDRAPLDQAAITVSIRDRVFEGVEAALPLGGLNALYFRGVDREYRRLLLRKASNDSVDADIAALRAELPSRLPSNDDPTARGVADDAGTEIVATGEGGAITRLVAG
jgi:hypothetical protein